MSAEKASFDPKRFKQQERAGFNLVAERYERGVEVNRGALERMVELARLETGGRVLDVACGPGLVSRYAARKVGEQGAIIGIDIAEQALEIGRKRAKGEGLENISFAVMDAEHLAAADESFDAVLIGLGLMHFPHPEKALQEAWRVLKPGGRVAVTVWGEEHEVDFLRLALLAITRQFPPPRVERPSMFRFGASGVVEGLLHACGFGEARVERLNASLTVAGAEEYWQGFLDAAGITTVSLAKQPPEVMQQLVAQTRQDLQAYRQGESYVLNNVSLAGVAVK
ncbi:methyltransferase domain-containing protein [Candidatus Chlorohelix sp.]|uniref:class I SAM-dependent methyltransferase n=1 Tax=Candidatus Chlorohelix sp. TaxID=3139201 RepID=UPI003020E0CA